MIKKQKEVNFKFLTNFTFLYRVGDSRFIIHENLFKWQENTAEVALEAKAWKQQRTFFGAY